MQLGDTEIAEAAVNRLAWNVSVPKDAIKVTVSKGWVTLTGSVHWHYQQDAAAHAVRTLWGVTGVSNQITIKPTANASNIKADIEPALNRSWFSPENISVTTRDGMVTLSGRVDFGTSARLLAPPLGRQLGVTSASIDVQGAQPMRPFPNECYGAALAQV